MRMTIKDCLELDALKAAEIIAGEENIDNLVRTVSVMDAQDEQAALENNGVAEQLVLTSFSGLDGLSRIKEKIITELYHANIAGVVIFHQRHGVKTIDEHVVAMAKVFGLPLILVPYDSKVTYSDVIEQVMDGLRYSDNAGKNLINSTVHHLLDFEKHGSFESALKEAAIKNQFQVVLLSKDFNPILTVETRQQAKISDVIKQGMRRNIEKTGIYTLVDVDGVLTYWGPITANGEEYFVFIVDNDDKYSAAEISKLAEIIELAMGMWKYTPERDAKAEFVKALIRNNKSLAYTLKDEIKINADDILSVFFIREIDENDIQEMLSQFEKAGLNVLRIVDDNEIYGVVFKAPENSKERLLAKLDCINLYESMKEGRKTVRIFHGTGINGVEGAGDAFKLINETWTLVEGVFPYKRVFTMYELALVSNCINIQVHGGHQKKIYMDLLEPFHREMGENKANQLLETLETFVLDAGMNSGKTSTFMNIHTNTVQYRLKRINEVLGAEITGNRVVPGLTIALALKRLEKVVK